ncbi:MAG: hypothetical protein GYB26_14995 [Gammaproteobacteria bacterium]|nr:hypothetical protein [Gammaproteobacteria bacterium]
MTMYGVYLGRFLKIKRVLFMALGYCLSFSVVHAAVIPPTAGPHTVSFSADQITVKDDTTGYSAVVQVESRLTLGVLVGEPVYTCVAAWKLLSVAAGDDGFDAGLTGAAEGSFGAGKLPPSVLRDITLSDVDIAYPLAPGLPINSSSLFVCDAGIMRAAGSDKPSFNFPSSPLWRELFWNDLTNRHEHPDTAKKRYADMLAAYETRAIQNSNAFSWSGSHANKWGSSVRSASINLWAVKSWLHTVLQEQAETARRKAESVAKDSEVLVDQRGAVNNDSFDTFMTAVYKKEEAKQALANLEHRKIKVPDSARVSREQMMVDFRNSSCADRASLAALNRDWDAGSRMQQTLVGCATPRSAPVYNQGTLKLTPRKY